MADDAGEVVGAVAGAIVGGDAVGDEGRSFRWLDPPRQRPLSTLRNSRDASGPALLFIQAEIGAVVRGVKAGEFDYPT